MQILFVVFIIIVTWMFHRIYNHRIRFQNIFISVFLVYLHCKLICFSGMDNFETLLSGAHAMVNIWKTQSRLIDMKIIFHCEITFLKILKNVFFKWSHYFAISFLRIIISALLPWIRMWVNIKYLKKDQKRELYLLDLFTQYQLHDVPQLS